ncbi:uncharacterized protein LOC143378003 isoform X2 [Andrena cerasifolii]|uniref:uncharacterized protein LOC143378003 isoform X2 n=1 Tax=Andrena cerasifolii TaxID=2819439 RepID=UPI004037F19D
MDFESGHHCKISRSIGVPLGLWPYRCTVLGIMNGAFAVIIIILFMVAQLAVFITHEFSVDLFHKCAIGIVPPTFYVMKYFYFMWNMDQKHPDEVHLRVDPMRL